MGHIFGFITADRVKWGGDDDDPIEESGWVDVFWSRKVLHESRNDVRPIVDCDEDDEWLSGDIKYALNWLPGGYEDNGCGTFYAVDTESSFTDAWTYSYAIHFTRKSLGPNGWVEEPWSPPADMRP